MSYELRDYQIEVVQEIERMNPGEHKLIVLPTGSGKTIVFANISLKAEGKVLIVVPSTELRTQAIDKLKKLDSDCDVGSVQAGLKEFEHSIICATRQSLSHKKSTRLETMIEQGDFEYVIFDEVHQGIDQIKLILGKLNSNVKVVGFTATAYNPKLKDIFEKIDCGKSILEMIEKDYLCEPKAYKVVTNTDISHVKMVAGEFNQKDLELNIDTPLRNQMVVEAYLKYAKDRIHTIIFCSGIEHSNHIMDAFILNGINCKTINSKNDKDDRAELLEGFVSGKFPIISNCNILSTGFDFEALDCIILASPTKSKTKYVQMIGRGLRIAPEKSDCLILDMKDTIITHDLMSMEDVFGVDMDNGESITEAKERAENEVIEKQKADEEEAIRQQELIAQEVALFNMNLGYALEETSSYDWWRIDKNTYALSTLTDHHYVIQKEFNEFNVYEVNSLKDHNHIEFINSSENVLDMVEFVEETIPKITSFMLVITPWKIEHATPAQLRAVKYAVVETKWDCHKYFSQWKIKQIMKAN